MTQDETPDEKVGRLTGSLAADQVKRAANRTMRQNCERDGVKYARVPTGAETCGFCIMLASRGFVYSSAEAAGELNHYHRSCDCKIVAGFQGETEIEGYDPNELYDIYVEARTRLGLSDPSTSRLSREISRVAAERKRKSPDYSHVPRETFGTLVNKSASFNPGDYTPSNIVNRGREWKDLFAHDALANAGIVFKPTKANAPEGFTNVDGQIGGRKYEIKSPENPMTQARKGRELAFVESNLRKAKDQFENQYEGFDGVVRVVFSSYYRDVDDVLIRAEIERQMKAHEISEVIFIRKDGTIERLTQ